MQHVFGPVARDAHFQRLQAGLHAGQRAVVVGAQLGDRAGVAALPLGEVVGHVRHEVREGAVGLAHHAVLVVAEVGGLQPQRAAFLVGVAGGDQLVHRLRDQPVLVQRAFQIVGVEIDAERGQVQVLLVAQPGHGKTADGVEIVRVLAAFDGAAFRLDGRADQVGMGHVGDVFAIVGGFRPAGIAGLEAARARLHRAGEVVDLHAGVVVIELAFDGPAVGVQQARQRVADRRGAAVADMQRAGRVGRDVFHAHGHAVAALVAAVILALLEHARGFVGIRGGAEVEVDEARAGDLDAGHVAAGRERIDQRLGQRTRVAARGLGQQHRGIGGEIAVFAGLGTLDDEIRRDGIGRQGAVGAQGFDALADQGTEQGFHGNLAGDAETRILADPGAGSRAARSARATKFTRRRVRPATRGRRRR